MRIQIRNRGSHALANETRTQVREHQSRLGLVTLELCCPSRFGRSRLPELHPSLIGNLLARDAPVAGRARGGE
jgi:hypothetical protein